MSIENSPMNAKHKTNTPPISAPYFLFIYLLKPYRYENIYNP